MATTKPRITISLDPKQHALLSRVATQQNKTMSIVIGELLQAVAPSFERMCVLKEQAAKSNDVVLGGLSRSVQRAQDVMEDLLGPSIPQLNLFERAKQRAFELDMDTREGREEIVQDAAAGDSVAIEASIRGGPRLRGGPGSRPGRSGKADPRPVITGVTGEKTVNIQRGSVLRKSRKKGAVTAQKVGNKRPRVAV